MKNSVLKSKPVFIFSVLILFVLVAAAVTTKHHNESKMLTAVFKKSPEPVPLYGINGNNTRGPAWTDKAFRDSAASLKFSLYRYPGGSLGEFWDWKKGWYVDFDQNRNAGGRYTAPESMTSMKFSPTGLKELALLVSQMHSEVVFDVNMVTKDLDDQIEMLKAAQSLGIAVKWVELGNEYNIPKSPGHIKYPTPSEYGADARIWAERIKQEFPGVKIAVIGGDEQYAQEVRSWNDDVLRKAPNVDGIVAHVYPITVKAVDDDGIDFEKLYSSFEDEYDRMGFNDVRKNVWVTEYNIHWAIVPAGDEGKTLQQFAFSWGQALAAILMTSEATTLPKQTPEILTEQNIANWNGFAALEARKDGIHILPSGIGMEAWYNASRGKNEMRQITFQKSGGGTMRDYEVLGWQFKSGNEETSLLVNFTGEPVNVNAQALLGGGKSSYVVKHADKNKRIENWSDVTHERRSISGNIVELPPYSIATI